MMGASAGSPRDGAGALGAAQREAIGRKLAAIRRRAETVLEKAESELRGEDSEQMRDLGATGDGGIAEAEFERDVAGAGQARAMLAAVESAQARLAAGDYGQCEDCGKDIGFARLEAQPTATRCVHCQEKAETAPLSRRPR